VQPDKAEGGSRKDPGQGDRRRRKTDRQIKPKVFAGNHSVAQIVANRPHGGEHQPKRNQLEELQDVFYREHGTFIESV
ncbi:MAG: hypothetical protein LBL04_01640, partial [Bacteroidales bacterium]|nr:hypothetical protein [Bacteroidales bacterium]